MKEPDPSKDTELVLSVARKQAEAAQMRKEGSELWKRPTKRPLWGWQAVCFRQPPLVPQVTE